jgi:hypothetical protein
MLPTPRSSDPLPSRAAPWKDWASPQGSVSQTLLHARDDTQRTNYVSQADRRKQEVSKRIQKLGVEKQRKRRKKRSAAQLLQKKKLAPIPKTKLLDGKAAQKQIFEPTLLPRSRLYSRENEKTHENKHVNSIRRSKQDSAKRKQHRKQLKVFRKSRAARTIQREFRSYTERRTFNADKAFKKLMLIIRTQRRWKRYVQKKKDERAGDFTNNIHRVIMVQRVIKKLKAKRDDARRRARKRSAVFRWNLVQSRFRDAVGADSMLSSSAFSQMRRMRNCSTVFLHNPLEFEQIEDCLVRAFHCTFISPPRAWTSVS